MTEIGIASGLTCCAIAPQVESYIGLDLSSETLKRTKETLVNRGITNVYLECADAMETRRVNAVVEGIQLLKEKLGIP